MQIAGRAGRYGLRGQPGGFVTTLHKEDIPTLYRALATPAPPLACAVFNPPGHWMENVSQALPVRASTQALLEVPSYVTYIRPPLRAATQTRLGQLSEFMNTPGICSCPIALDALAQILRLYTNAISVKLDVVLSVAPFMSVMMRDSDHQPKVRVCKEALKHDLEGLHKVLVLYLWLSFGNAMAFYDADGVWSVR